MAEDKKKLTTKEAKELKHRLLARYNHARRFGATRKIRKMAKNRRLRLLGKKRKVRK